MIEGICDCTSSFQWLQDRLAKRHINYNNSVSKAVELDILPSRHKGLLVDILKKGEPRLGRTWLRNAYQ